MYNSNTDSLGLILDVEVFFSLGHCSGALCAPNTKEEWRAAAAIIQNFVYSELGVSCNSESAEPFSRPAAFQTLNSGNNITKCKYTNNTQTFS